MQAAEAYQDVIRTLTPSQGEGEAQSITRLLFEDLLDWKKGHSDRSLSEQQLQVLAAAKKRLLAGEPLQYITERADFYGLALKVSPAVLIPRPETEELVEWVLDQRSTYGSALSIIDIGTGSGCIPLAIKNNWPQAQVHGLDVSNEALAIAKLNAEALELDVNWIEQSILDEDRWTDLPSMDIIISNPPYIPYQEADLMPDVVKEHEPGLALFVEDEDSLLFYRRIMVLALVKLKANGLLFFECNEFNAQDVHQLGEQLGFQDAELRKDLQGKWRMWKGRRPAMQQ